MPLCRDEHPVITGLAKSGIGPIVGLNYKDVRNEALAWLARNGDAYTLSVSDTQGRVGIYYGVYGVPETLVIDKQGVIRYKHIGPVTQTAVRKPLLPLIWELQHLHIGARRCFAFSVTCLPLRRPPLSGHIFTVFTPNFTF